jgi:hypothetical protein
MLFDIGEIQHYQNSNPNWYEGDKYGGVIEAYDYFNGIASLDVFDWSVWYEALAASMPRGFSDDEKERIVNKLKNILGVDYEKFIISHCTTSHDGGYDCWIMDIAFEIISEKAEDVTFIKWFSELFSSLTLKEDYNLELDDVTYGLWRVWTWHDEEEAKKLFSNLGVNVEKMIQTDEAIDEAYGSGW